MQVVLVYLLRFRRSSLLKCAGLVRYRDLTPGRTDGWTDRQTDIRYALTIGLLMPGYYRELVLSLYKLAVSLHVT